MVPLRSQLRAVLSYGVTVVVSPLISLMQDQVRSLINRGDGIPAIAITSAMDDGLARGAYAELGRGAQSPLKLLYVSPEKLDSSGTLSDILQRLYEEVCPASAHDQVAVWSRDRCQC